MADNKDKIEPIIHKLSEAVSPPEDITENLKSGKPPDDTIKIDMKEHNAHVQPTRDERLVGLGRGHDTSGRGDPRDQKD